MEIKFERAALYDRVWGTPMSRLAAEFHLSDNGLRKVCKSLNVPWPPRGYWAKKAAGKEVKQPPLPPQSPRETFTSRPPVPAPPSNPYRREEDALWLEGRLAFEADPINKVLCEAAPKTWHPGLSDLRALLTTQIKTVEGWKALHDRLEAQRAKYPNRRQPWSFDDHRWQSHIDHGSVISTTHHNTSPIRVSPETVGRALALLNTVFRASEKRGIQADIDITQGRFRLQLESASIHFAVRERLEDDWRDAYDSSSGKVKKLKYKRATGRLFIALYTSYAGRNFRDNSDGIFTDLNLIFFEPLYRKVVETRERAREDVEKKRRHEMWMEQKAALEAERATENARKKEVERLRAIEQLKEDALVAEVASWDRAFALRAYLDHLNGVDPEFSRSGWMAWARSVAERMDPTARRVSGAIPDANDIPVNPQAAALRTTAAVGTSSTPKGAEASGQPTNPPFPFWLKAREWR